MQNLARETNTFRNTAAQTALPMRRHGSFTIGEGVGGSGLHLGGVLWRLMPWDHEARRMTIERYGAVAATTLWAADAIKNRYLKSPGALA